MISPRAWLQETFYGRPTRAVGCLNLAFGATVGLATRSFGWGAAAALAGAWVWDRVSPSMVISDLRLGPVMLRVPLTDRPQGQPIWLTFDDGPGQHTEAVLDILQQHQAPATFFLIGERVAGHPEPERLAARFLSGGHAVGHHSWSHPSFLSLTSQQAWSELSRADALLRETFPHSWLPLFRPPFGYRTRDLFTHLHTLGLHTVGWSLNSLDFLAGDVARLVQRVVEQTEPGSIVLFHDGPADRTRTVAALPIILSELKARGFTFAVPTREALLA